MQIPSHNEIESWILKVTFSSVFIGVTLLFVVKMGSLFVYAIQIKRDALIAYLNSGQAITDLGEALWKIIKEAVKGGSVG